MPTLRPFQNYDEKDMINLFAYGGTIPANKGTIVKLQGSGFVPSQEALEMLGNVGAYAVGNVVTQRYGTVPKVTSTTSATDKAVGMLLFDVREQDENNQLLIYRPYKQYEMECALSGQTVPIVTRGTFAYSGVTTGGGLEGAIPAGANLYPANNGLLSLITGWFSGGAYFSGAVPATPIAISLGASDSSNVTVIQLNIC
jgi:hypothetical protein